MFCLFEWKAVFVGVVFCGEHVIGVVCCCVEDSVRCVVCFVASGSVIGVLCFGWKIGL